jgi:Copper transport outer membrane protein, MctB
VINFRYHLVSLVAVFLALAIGIVAGSTVIKESILDQTQQNLDNAEKNLKQLEDSNNRLKAENDQLKARDDALDANVAAELLQQRLTGVPVLLVKVDGVDGHSADMLRTSVSDAGAQVAGVVTVTDRLALTAPADVARLRDLLGTTDLDPTALRAELAAHLATLVTGVSDSQPARLGDSAGRATTQTPTTVTPESTDEPTTTTTTPPTASMQASTRLRQFLGDLDDAGFAKFSDKPDGAATMDLSGLRLAVMSGGGAKLDNGMFLYPFLQRLGAGVDPATVAVEATPDGATIERGSFVGPIRDDASLRDRVSTVDDAEWFVGWAASVLALAGLDNGVVGHYGVGKGADGLLPSTSR